MNIIDHDIKNKLFSLVQSYDSEYIKNIIRKLSINHDKSKSRLAGTKSEHEIANYIAGEMEKLGLNDVRLSEVPVKSWELHTVRLTIKKPITWEIDASTYAGVPTSTAEGQIIFGDKGIFKEDADLKDKIILIDMDYDVFPYIDIIAKEVSTRGGVGVILSHMTKRGLYDPLDDTLHSADSDYDLNLPPLVYIRKRDAIKLLKLIEKNTVYGEINISTSLYDSVGYNVIGTYGEGSDIIVISAHHDGYFYGVLDNASGVSMLLSIAKYLADHDIDLNHKLMFISFTAEEFGDIETPYGYLIGSYVWTENNKDLLNKVFLNINMDVLGYFEGPIGIQTTLDLKDYVVKTIELISKYIDVGFSVGYIPSSWNDMWNFVRNGISSIHFGARGNISYYIKYYHTDKDTLDILSDNKLSKTFATILFFLFDIDNKSKKIIDYAELYKEIHNYSLKYGVCRELTSLSTEIIIRDLNKTKIDDEYYKVGKQILSKYYRLSGWYPTCSPKPFFMEYNEEIRLLEEIADAINNNDYETAVKIAEKINLNKWAKYVSKETFYYVWERIKKPKNWGKYNVHPYFDVYELLNKLKNHTIGTHELNKYILERRENLKKEVEELYNLTLELKSYIG